MIMKIEMENCITTRDFLNNELPDPGFFSPLIVVTGLKADNTKAGKLPETTPVSAIMDNNPITIVKLNMLSESNSFPVSPLKTGIRRIASIVPAISPIIEKSIDSPRNCLISCFL
jgi:hypothetical protein